MKKQVLVFGGAGFIGTNVCLSALKKGYDVVVFDNLSRKGGRANLQSLQHVAKTAQAQVQLMEADIRDRKAVESAFKTPDSLAAVFHLAGQVAVTTSVEAPFEDFEINVAGTLHILESLRKSGSQAPLLYSSTNKVYGDMLNADVVENKSRYDYRRHTNGIDEAFPLSFHSPYGCSKGAADQYVLDYARIYGIRATVFRQSCIYGPLQFGIEDQGWVAWFAISGLLNKPITLFGNGKQVRDVLFIDDLIDLYWKSIDQIEVATGQAYNVGGGIQHNTSLLDFLDLLETLIQKKLDVHFADSRPGDQKVFISDTAKAQKQLNWHAQTDLRRGTQTLIDWIQSNLALFKS